MPRHLLRRWNASRSSRTRAVVPPARVRSAIAARRECAHRLGDACSRVKRAREAARANRKSRSDSLVRGARSRGFRIRIRASILGFEFKMGKKGQKLLIACNTFVFQAGNVMCFLYYLSTNCAKLLTIRLFEMIRTFRERGTNPWLKLLRRLRRRQRQRSRLLRSLPRRPRSAAKERGFGSAPARVGHLGRAANHNPPQRFSSSRKPEPFHGLRLSLVLAPALPGFLLQPLIEY